MTGAAFERCGSPDLVYGADIVGRPETGSFPLILCGAAMGGTTTSAQRGARRQDNVGESNRAERSANVQTDRDKHCPDAAGMLNLPSQPISGNTAVLSAFTAPIPAGAAPHPRDAEEALPEAQSAGHRTDTAALDQAPTTGPLPTPEPAKSG